LDFTSRAGGDGQSVRRPGSCATHARARELLRELAECVDVRNSTRRTANLGAACPLIANRLGVSVISGEFVPANFLIATPSVAIAARSKQKCRGNSSLMRRYCDSDPGRVPPRALSLARAMDSRDLSPGAVADSFTVEFAVEGVHFRLRWIARRHGCSRTSGQLEAIVAARVGVRQHGACYLGSGLESLAPRLDQILSLGLRTAAASRRYDVCGRAISLARVSSRLRFGRCSAKLARRYAS